MINEKHRFKVVLIQRQYSSLRKE